MVSYESRLFCRLDGSSPEVCHQQRTLTLMSWGLLSANKVPVFDEATQMAADTLEMPLGLLGFPSRDSQWFKSTVGLSRFGVMNTLVRDRRLPYLDSFCQYVIDSQQPLAIANTAIHATFTNSALTQHYGIASYLGVPLMTSTGQCLGTLEVMDLQARNFSQQDVVFLELLARWCMSEFERGRHLNPLPFSAVSNRNSPSTLPPGPSEPLPADAGTAPSTGETVPASHEALPQAQQLSYRIIQIKYELLTCLVEELRNPITPVLGMASVLKKETFGSLSPKQKEYLDVIYQSGQTLTALVSEILDLGDLREMNPTLNLSAVDIEMLCQQAINTLTPKAEHRDQQFRLTVGPGTRIWQLDKDKVRQILYYLMFSLMQSINPGSTIRLHVSRKPAKLAIAVWASHPWLGEGFPYADLLRSSQSVTDEISGAESTSVLSQSLSPASDGTPKREQLALSLSCQLAELHGGKLMVQGSTDSGYRFVVSLPQLPVSS